FLISNLRSEISDEATLFGVFPQRMAGGEFSQQLFLEGGRPFLLGGLLPHLLIQMRLSCDFGVLEGICPSAQLSGTGFVQGYKIRNSSFEIGLANPTLLARKYGANFTSRATGNIDECEQFIGRAALEALGNVIGNRERRTIELVAKSKAGLKVV